MALNLMSSASTSGALRFTGPGHHSWLPDAHFELGFTEDKAVDFITTSLTHPTLPHSNTFSVGMNGSIGDGLAMALKSENVPTEVPTHSPRL